MKKWIAMILAVLTVGVIILLYLFIPVKEQIRTELSAVMLNKKTGKVETTTIEIYGEWSKSRLNGQSPGFQGRFKVDALQYTWNDDWEQSGEFAAVEGRQYMQGFLQYKSAEGALEASVLYVNEDRTVYVYYDEDCIVFAPAENEDDAYLICRDLGLDYPG